MKLVTILLILLAFTISTLTGVICYVLHENYIRVPTKKERFIAGIKGFIVTFIISTLILIAITLFGKIISLLL